jgi:ribosomal protein S18 acetylase RimI-like enzyme
MTAAVEMRQATPADAPAMAEAHVDSICTLGPAFYSAPLVEAWGAGITPEMYVRAMQEGEVFFIALGAIDGEPAVLGFASHRPDGGDDSASCYVRGSAARQGIGSALWRTAEAHARSRGTEVITIQASLAGVAFYRAHGFVEIGTEDARLQTGALIPCVVMRKRLDGALAE